MQTVSLYILNLLAPCHCACRYCFLCAGGGTTGVEYGRGEALARRIHAALPALPLSYTCGYCYDYPELARGIAFNRELGFAGAGYLQVNGIAPRGPEDLRTWLGGLKAAGAHSVDATFYGLEPAHDKFAGRRGDFQLLLHILRAAQALDYQANVTFPITEENKDDLDPMLKQLESEGCTRFFGYLPDCRGRGALLEDIRLTQASREALGPQVCGKVNWSRYRTEAAWLQSGFAEPEKRQLRLVLTQETIARWEAMAPAQIIAELERLDEQYYAALPPMEELARLYGDPQGRRLCRDRDLRWKYGGQYRLEHGIDIHDVTDESASGSIRF